MIVPLFVKSAVPLSRPSPNLRGSEVRVKDRGATEGLSLSCTSWRANMLRAGASFRGYARIIYRLSPMFLWPISHCSLPDEYLIGVSLCETLLESCSAEILKKQYLTKMCLENGHSLVSLE